MDGTFRRIAPVNIWWHQLVLYLGLFEDCLHVSGTFVVDNVYIWCLAVGFEYLIGCLPLVAYVCRVTTFDQDTIGGFSIIMIKYKDVFVSSVGRDRKFTCLVVRRLTQFLRRECCAHNIMCLDVILFFLRCTVYFLDVIFYRFG